MGLLKAIFHGWGKKDRSTLRAISKTTKDGITKVNPDALFKHEAFIKKANKMNIVVRDVVSGGAKEQYATTHRY
jgi:hypothetical protein